MPRLKPLLLLLTFSLLSCETTRQPASTTSGFGKSSQCGEILVGVTTEKPELELVGATLKEFSLGKLDITVTPQFQRITSEAAMNEDSKIKVACKAIEMAGVEGKPEMVAYFIQMQSFLSTNPSLDDRIKWHKAFPIPSTSAVPKVEFLPEGDVIKFGSADPNKKMFTIGDCPGPHCYTVERGEAYAMWWFRPGLRPEEVTKADGQKIEGQIFHIFGTGLVTKSEFNRNGDYIETRTFDIKGKGRGLPGERVLFTDGSFEYRWLKPIGPKPASNHSTKIVSNYQFAVWIPIEKESWIIVSTPDRDIAISVADDATNDQKFLARVSPGTFCSRRNLAVVSDDIREACRGK